MTSAPGLSVVPIIALRPILVAVLSVIPGLLWANDAPLRSVGKAIRPREDVSVRMLTEKVEITIDNSVAYVKCVFTLVNEGPADTVLVGFPRDWEKDLYDFRAWAYRVDFPVQDGAAEPQYGGEAGEIKWWKTFEVPFKSAGDTVQVHNYYWTLLADPLERTNADLKFRYVLRTGALWKDTIEDARITITLRNTHPDQVTQLSPEGYTRQGQQIEWHFRDFEPGGDISIQLVQDVLYERQVLAGRLLEQDPESAEGHFLLGSYHFNREEHPKPQAMAEFCKALAADPMLWDARWYLALIYYFGNNPEGARRQLEELLKGAPGYRCVDPAFPFTTYVDMNHDPAMLLKDVMAK